MASDAVVNLVVDATGTQAQLTAQLRTIVDEAERTAPPITIQVNIDNRQLNEITQNITNGLADVDRQTLSVDRDTDRLAATFTRLGGAALSAIATAGKIGIIGSLAASSLVPVAGLVAGLAQIAPAGAAAVSAFVAMQAATTTLKVGLIGVSDAISAVFDPNADPEKVAEALERLSGNARDFVLQLQDMKPALDSLRLDIQDQLFSGLDKTLAQTAKATLPDLEKASLDFASTFNQMAKGTGAAAQQLAAEGTLGRALGSGGEAFAKLERIPGQVLLAIGRLADGGGPLLNRFADAVSNAADSITDKLAKASESGALEDAVNAAGDALAQLGRIAGNVFGALSNVLNTASESGGSLFGTLEQVTQALEDATATEMFQETLTALIGVGQTLVNTVLPLLGLAFQALAPAIQLVAPVVEQIVTALGEDLTRLIPELSPLLEEIGLLFNQILLALLPLVDEGVGVLIELMPSLVELFSELIDLVVELTPLIQVLAPFIGGVLIGALVGATQQLIVITEILTEFISWVNAAVDATEDFAQTALGQVLTRALLAVVVLLQGDWRGAWALAQNVVQGAAASILRYASDVRTGIETAIGRAMASLVSSVQSGWSRAVSATVQGVGSVVGAVGDLRSRVLGVLSGLTSSFYSAGRNLVSSFASGIRSMIGDVADAASDIASAARDYLPFSPAKKGPLSGRGYPLYSGQEFGLSFIRGIESTSRELDRVMQRFTGNSARPLSSGLVSAPTAGASTFAGVASTVFTRLNPTVNVYLGNELVTDRVQAIVDQSTEQRDRLAAQGVRV